MADHNTDNYISDSGVIQSNKTKQARRFVFLCNIITAALAILGLIAFCKGFF